MHRCVLSWLLAYVLLVSSSSAQSPPFAMRISCGARENVHTPPNNTLWLKDFGFTGGITYSNATLPSYPSPPLETLRYFPFSSGPENCYNINRVPKGHYSVRIFFGFIPQQEENFDTLSEPLFDVSVEGTQIYSLKPRWSGHDDQVFIEALVFLKDGTASICFHFVNEGDPTIKSIEILQVDHNAYYFGSLFGEGIILRTATRLSCGARKPKFDVDYSGDHWGGDRFWKAITTFDQGSDSVRSTKNNITLPSVSPNFYPRAIYQTALVSTDTQPDLAYTMDVPSNRHYSIWLHFAEIDSAVTAVGQRVFNILINGYTVFKDIDVIKMSGDRYTALVLNTTVAINGRTLTIALNPKAGSHAIINAIEVFEVIVAESRTSLDEVRALQIMKSALGLPLWFGWNGDPCVPQQHPWSDVDCQFDTISNKWVINELGLDNEGLSGFLPKDISKLRHLRSIHLSGNSIRGSIPSSLGTISSLEVLDLSYNFFNGSVPKSLGQLTSLRRLNLNGNSLHGRVPAGLGGRLSDGASFNFTDNAGLCGIPGLHTCGAHLTAMIAVGLSVSVAFVIVVICATCWWKRRQNILWAQQIPGTARLFHGNLRYADRTYIDVQERSDDESFQLREIAEEQRSEIAATEDERPTVRRTSQRITQPPIWSSDYVMS